MSSTEIRWYACMRCIKDSFSGKSSKILLLTLPEISLKVSSGALYMKHVPLWSMQLRADQGKTNYSHYKQTMFQEHVKNTLRHNIRKHMKVLMQQRSTSLNMLMPFSYQEPFLGIWAFPFWWIYIKNDQEWVQMSSRQQRFLWPSINLAQTTWRSSC